MRPKEKRTWTCAFATPASLTSLIAGAVAVTSLALGIVGLKAEFVPPTYIQESNGDAAAQALASMLRGGTPLAPKLIRMSTLEPAWPDAGSAGDELALPALAFVPALSELPALPALFEAAGLATVAIEAPALAAPSPMAALQLGAALMQPPDMPALLPPLTLDADAQYDIAVAEPVSQAAPAQSVRKLSIRPGDNLVKALQRAGVESGDAHAASQALTTVQDPRRLQVGQQLTVTFDTDDGNAPRLLSVNLAAGVDRAAVARRDARGDFSVETIDRELVRDVRAAAGDIDLSLYVAAEAAGVPGRVIVDLIRLYSFDIDFQRDIHAGDRFELYYEVVRNGDGRTVKTGDILYARLIVGDKELPLYRFRHADGDVGYYNDKGESVRKALMKTPVDGARLSSGFGLRRHPILGYTKMHRGIDFAAPAGTPIVAAGDGQVELAGWNGGYGRYARIRHNAEFKTAYAHMTRLAKGIVTGRRVKQGEIIGYVGSTGQSTGPHLHYEVLREDRQINPMGLKLPTGRTLSGGERVAFQAQRKGVAAGYLAALPAPMRLAKSE
jgi:murein DD-endopeptidase MepM/ murein hydrolase activator NlpD